MIDKNVSKRIIRKEQIKVRLSSIRVKMSPYQEHPVLKNLRIIEKSKGQGQRISYCSIIEQLFYY